MSKKHALKKYKTYVFKDQDPMVQDVLTMMDGHTYTEISARSGLSRTTLSNWKRKRTQRPQFCTMAAALGVVGMEFKIGKKGG